MIVENKRNKQHWYSHSILNNSIMLLFICGQ